MALHEDMAVCPYGALNQGRFQTKAGFEAREKDNSQGRNFKPLTEVDKRVSSVMEDLAEARGDDTSLLNIALAYILQKSPYTFPIIGGRKVEHLTTNLNSLKVALTPEEIKAIDGAYDFDHGFPTSFLCGSLFDAEKSSKMVVGPADVMFQNLAGRTNMEWVDVPRAIRPKQSE